MSDTANNVIDARLQEALGQYFNGVTLRERVGDCAILSGIRKQNGAPVDIYTPSFEVAGDDAVRGAITKEFETYEKLSSNRIQSAERILTSRSFKKTPALALLSCPIDVFDDAFDTRAPDAKLQIFDEILEGLSVLHGAGIIHGNVNANAVRRENSDGALRLCDFTFCGARNTQMTAQPAAYQSRHVINTSQPRLEDDIHAAGMLGYRLLLGPFGPEKVLLGTAEAEDTTRIISAILGEEAAAPGAEDLFPEGHASAEQIARLLARMTGRLPNATAYSSAEAVLKAFRSVVANPNVGVAANTENRIGTAPQPDVAIATAMMPQTNAENGVSKLTAIALFGGFLISTATAVYYYFQNEDARDTLYLAMTQNETLREELTESRALVTEIKTSTVAMQNAIRALTEARLSHAELASDTSAEQFATALASLSTARAALDDDDTQTAITQAELTEQSALKSLETVSLLKTQEVSAAAETSQMRARAEKAGGNNSDSFTHADMRAQEAKDLNANHRYALAIASWQDSATGFETTFNDMKATATARKTALQSTKMQASAEKTAAGYVLGLGLERRADAAFDVESFADASKLYDAAIAAFSGAKGVTRQNPVPANTGDKEARDVMIGEDDRQLANAVRLCLDDAPIDDESCPKSRPSDESARRVSVTPFELDTTEVSASDFARFVTATDYITEAEKLGKVVALTSSGEARFIESDYSWQAPGGKNTTYQTDPDLPVTSVSMKDAAAYCDWASGRLPTEAEWETAAHGGSNAAFPTGDWSPQATVWRGAGSAQMRLPQPVNAAGAPSPRGHVGMSGNAREWVIAADGAVLKGGSWNTANPADLRIAARLTVPQNAPGVDFGFRCARDLEAWQ